MYIYCIYRMNTPSTPHASHTCESTPATLFFIYVHICVLLFGILEHSLKTKKHIKTNKIK